MCIFLTTDPFVGKNYFRGTNKNLNNHVKRMAVSKKLRMLRSMAPLRVRKGNSNHHKCGLPNVQTNKSNQQSS